MPGAAALPLISGGSSAMTGIFSSSARVDSEEILAADWVSGTAIAAGAALAGLVFSVAAGGKSCVEGCGWAADVISLAKFYVCKTYSRYRLIRTCSLGLVGRAVSLGQGKWLFLVC